MLTSDGARERWDVSGPHFAGWEIYHVKGSPADPNRIYASQISGWFGQVIQRSDDGGKTWEPVGNEFVYDGVPGTHQWYDGTPHPWEFKRVWHLEPSLTDPRHGLRRRRRRRAVPARPTAGRPGRSCPGCATHGSGPSWAPGAGGMCLHTILLDPTNAERMFIAISAAGAFRTDDGGETWRPINQGLQSRGHPRPDGRGRPLRAPHRACTRRGPNVLFMQKHWDVMRSDDGGDSWREVSGNLPTDFGFAIDVHAHEPETIYVVPIKSDSEHFPPDGKLRVYRSRDAAATSGSRSPTACRRRTATSTCCATPWPSTRSTPAASTSAPPAGRSTPRPMPATPGRRSCATCRPCSRSRCRRCDMIRVDAADASAHARAGRMATCELDVAGSGRRWRSVLDALEAQLSRAARHHPRPRRRSSGAPFLRFFACEEDLSHDPPDTPLPEAVATGAEPFLVVGAMAGG